MAKVYILIGKIASGKTHFVRKLKKSENVMQLSCDDLFLTLFDGCLGEKHDDIQNKAYQFFNGQAVQLVNMGISVALDFGFWTAESRKIVKDFYKEKGIETVSVYFDIPEDIRIERLENRNQQLINSKKREYIIDNILRKKLDEKFEAPTSNEYDLLVIK